jgi:hypothetical protein
MERHDPLRSPGLRHPIAALALFSLLGGGTALGAEHPPGRSEPEKGTSMMTGTVRIGYLHHSTGAVVWSGGVDGFVRAWNAAHGTDYRAA